MVSTKTLEGIKSLKYKLGSLARPQVVTRVKKAGGIRGYRGSCLQEFPPFEEGLINKNLIIMKLCPT